MTTDPRLIECANSIKALEAFRLLKTGVVNPGGDDYRVSIARACILKWLEQPISEGMFNEFAAMEEFGAVKAMRTIYEAMCAQAAKELAGS